MNFINGVNDDREKIQQNLLLLVQLDYKHR